MAHRLSPEAEEELVSIWDYIANVSGSINTADRLIDGLTSTFVLLATQPHMGRRRDEDLRVGMRSFVFGNYVVLYRTEGTDVFILHVVQGSRDVMALFGQ